MPASLLLASALLVVVALLSRQSSRAAFDDLQWVDHTMRVRIELGDLASTLERGMRGDAGAVDEVFAHAQQVADLMRDHKEQQARAQALTRNLSDALHGDAGALDAARAGIERMDQVEQALLVQREARAHESVTRTRLVAGWGFFVAAVLALVAFVVHTRGQRERERVLGMLAKSEQMHRVLVESATAMITLRDLGGRFLYSRNTERVTGWTEAEITAMPWIDFVHPEDRPNVVARELGLVAGDDRGALAPRYPRESSAGSRSSPASGGPSEVLRYRAKHKDGSWRWLESASSVVRGDGAVATAIRSATRDVTRDVLRDQALRRNEQLYRTAMEHAPNAAILLVDHDLRCLKAGGKALLATIGVHEPEGQLLRDFIAPHNVETAEVVYRAALRGEAQRVEITRSGHVFVVNIVPVRDENDNIFAAMSFANDVTELRLEASALERATARLNALIDNLRFGVLFEDVDQKTRRANTAFATMHGATVAEVESLDRPQRIAHLRRAFADPAGVEALTLAHLAAGEPVVNEILRAADGRVLERDYVPVRVNGEHIGNLWCIRDVSEREAKEALLRKQSEELRMLSTRDELTGLANRRGLFAGAGELLGEAARSGRVAAVLFADLNGMKSINDALGHESGDRALMDATRVLGSVFGSNAIVARLGGDEFVVLYTAHDEDDADHARQVLVDEIASFNARGERKFRLSMSVGIAVAEAPFPPLDALLSRADTSMYEQKRERRALARSLPPVRLSLARALS